MWVLPFWWRKSRGKSLICLSPWGVLLCTSGDPGGGPDHLPRPVEREHDFGTHPGIIGRICKMNLYFIILTLNWTCVWFLYCHEKLEFITGKKKLDSLATNLSQSIRKERRRWDKERTILATATNLFNIQCKANPQPSGSFSFISKQVACVNIHWTGLNRYSVSVFLA